MEHLIFLELGSRGSAPCGFPFEGVGRADGTIYNGQPRIDLSKFPRLH